MPMLDNSAPRTPVLRKLEVPASIGSLFFFIILVTLGVVTSWQAFTCKILSG